VRRFCAASLEAVLNSKKRLIYEPRIAVPFFDGEDIISYPQADRFLQRLATVFVLDERDLVHLKRELWTVGASEREKRGK
jgi:hypothetical protein